MHDKWIFIDTNLWIYLFFTSQNKADTEKRRQIKQLIKQYSNIIISTQVMNELSNVCLKKYQLNIESVETYLRELSNIVEIHILDVQTSFSALNLLKKYKFSFYDALIVASTLETNCEILFLEDMQHSQIIENKLLIQNPYNYEF